MKNIYKAISSGILGVFLLGANISFGAASSSSSSFDLRSEDTQKPAFVEDGIEYSFAGGRLSVWKSVPDSPFRIVVEGVKGPVSCPRMKANSITTVATDISKATFTLVDDTAADMPAPAKASPTPIVCPRSAAVRAALARAGRSPLATEQKAPFTAGTSERVRPNRSTESKTRPHTTGPRNYKVKGAIRFLNMNGQDLAYEERDGRRLTLDRCDACLLGEPCERLAKGEETCKEVEVELPESAAAFMRFLDF